MPGFHACVYNVAAAGVNAINTDLTVGTGETEFTPRNGHLLLTEPYKLWGAMAIGASVIRGRFQAPSWNALAEWQIFNANRSLQPPSNPQWDVYDVSAPQLPMYEEFQVQLSNNLGASTEIENVLLWLLTPDWSPQKPAGLAEFIIRASFTVTPTLNAWSGGQVITLSTNIRNGIYAVVGGTCQGTNAAAWRIIFPNFAPQRGRRLRPGAPIQNAIGDTLPNQVKPWTTNMGEWGRFWSLELPTVEVFGTAAVSTTYQVFLWVRFLGFDPSLMAQGLGGGSKAYSVAGAQPFGVTV